MRMNWLRRRMRARDASGFTLLEVVIAMAILSVGLLSIAAAQLAALHISARSRDHTTAMHLAEQKMEEFQGLPVASLPASGADANNPLDPDPGDDDRTTYTRRWTVQANTPVVDVTTLTVEVDWVDPKSGVTRTTRLESLKAQ